MCDVKLPAGSESEHAKQLAIFQHLECGHLEFQHLASQRLKFGHVEFHLAEASAARSFSI